jgi:hypothetical protein
MKNVSQVNEKYFRQAIDAMNESDLYGIQIKLSDELKESTLKVFMENVEAVPVEKEAEIVPKIVEMYNFIFDDEYQIPEGIFDEEEAVMVVEEQTITEGTTEAVGEKAEAPVKEKKEKKVKEPKAPKEPKVKAERKPRPPVITSGPSRKQQVYAKWLENKEMTAKEMMEVCSDLSLKTMVSWRYSWKKGTNLPKGASV